MWPESSSVNAVNLAKKFATIPEISNFSEGITFFWCALYTGRRHISTWLGLRRYVVGLSGGRIAVTPMPLSASDKCALKTLIIFSMKWKGQSTAETANGMSLSQWHDRRAGDVSRPSCTCCVVMLVAEASESTVPSAENKLPLNRPSGMLSASWKGISMITIQLTVSLHTIDE